MAEENTGEAVRFALVDGGLLRRFFLRLGIVRTGRVDAVRQALVLVAVAWLPLLALTLLGASHFSWSGSLVTDVEVNVRLLVALPLLVLAQIPVEIRVGDVTEYVWRSGLLPAGGRARWQAILSDARRRRDSVLPDLVLVVLAYAVTWAVFLARPSVLAGHEATSDWFAKSVEARHLRLAGYWYLLISLPLYLFLVLGWLRRLAIWTRVLANLASLPLRLQPGHPDRASGLDVVFRGQLAFAFVFVGPAAASSGALAAELIYGGTSVVVVALVAASFVVVAFVIILAPTMTLVPNLVGARRRALVEQGILSGRLVRQFAEKWIEADHAPEEALVGSPDPSSVADQGTAYDYVTRTRVTPLDSRTMAHAVGILVVPFLPLVLLRVPMKEIVKVLAQMLL